MASLESARVIAPFPSCIPTRRIRDIRDVPEYHAPRMTDLEQTEDKAHREKGSWERESYRVEHLYRTRDNRKGRHPIVIYTQPTQAEHPRQKQKQKESTETYITPHPTHTLKAFLHTLRKLFTSFPAYDISYLVAFSFVIGSVLWVVNGFFAWLPLVAPHTEFAGEERTGTGVTACVGATIFAFGSVLLLLEAVNENRTECFGWVVERQERQRSEDSDNPSELEKGISRHLPVGANDRLKRNVQEKERTNNSKHRKASGWVWFPSLKELRHHYLRDIGFLASFSQFLGAMVFWISGFTAIPQIQDTLEHRSKAHLNGAYWLPQVIGSLGFIVSGHLFMLETQSKWWKPNFKSLGWWVGFWNAIGAWGFLLCGAFGFWDSSAGEYQASLSTWWGSWAFLFGSLIQWYESVQKFPVEVGSEDD
ncbi:integral membrane protein [Ascobolus immersus RN42]|uniref:Integral membrane protein n=1 Tax=Ascobolus immersus RN42 TaxID=1160509 RepID=A0A3N4I007_ASCIM|nr:integral membrane protein [Ascobolus immersus RN42]